ncbi:TPA: hypothetical protein O5M19_001824 [Enterococcus faecium]|uniref:hypothetical protein n=1 Tax=Enterococcus sp. DIV0206e TaxID=2774690 RepID=UPI002EBDB062|nr:hypothetical protein [Enterococcus faecium]HDA6121885.1 hypothetical protein [Enterococcus faecium]
MEKRMDKGKIGVIVSKAYGISYASEMNLLKQNIARMDKDLVDFLLNDSKRTNKELFLDLMQKKGINDSDGLFDYNKLAVEWIKKDSYFYVEECGGKESLISQEQLFKA